MALINASVRIWLVGYKPSGKYYSEFDFEAKVKTLKGVDGNVMFYTPSLHEAVGLAKLHRAIPRELVYVLDREHHPTEVPALFPIAND